MAEEEADGERWLTPGVGGIGAASLLDDTGHEIATALLPSLLTVTLGAPAAALGLIEGIADACSGVARLGGGALADDPHRRRTAAVGGYAATSVLSAAIGLAAAAWQVGVLRTGSWTARGLRTPARNALLADLVSPGMYGRAYGFERAMDNLGAIVGPLLAIALLAALGIRGAILASVAPGLLGAAAITYAVRTTPLPTSRQKARLRLRLGAVLGSDLRRLFVAISAYECGDVAATLLILRATDLLAAHRSHHRAATLAIVLYIGYNAAASLASVPAGRLGDRRGFGVLLGGGALLGALALAGFAAGGGLALLGASFVAAGIANALTETAQHAVVAGRAPAALRGSAFGLLAAIQSAGNLLASALVGVLWTLASPGWAFTYAAACMVVAAGAFALASSEGR